MSEVLIRPMRRDDVEAAVALQKEAFPPPFSEDLHWDPEHLRTHVRLFPEGQFVAEAGGSVVGSCSNCVISEERWQSHSPWGRTVGGPFLRNHDAHGTTLYGLDITVHRGLRRQGVGRAFYERRFELVRRLGLNRYGTACRIPGFAASGIATAEGYVESVVRGETTDRTLTPLLRYGLLPGGVIQKFMPDPESGDAAAVLEWNP